MTITSNIFQGKGESLIPSVLALPVKTPVNAVAASGVVTFTGTPLAHVTNVNAYGTATITGTPVSTANVDATGTVTITGTPVLNEELVVGAQTFAFKVLRTGIGEITIDIDSTAQAANIVAAIAADLITVTATNTLGVVHITAVAHGAAGNSLALTTNATGIAVSGSGTLTGGVTAVVQTLVVGAQTFTFKASGIATGDIVISATPAIQAANIVTSITRDLATVTAVQGTGGNTHVVTITAVAAGTAGNSLTLTTNATGVAVSGAGTLANGTNHVHESIFVGTQEFIFVTTRTGAGSFEITVNANNTTQGDNLVAALADVSNVTATNSSGAVTVTAATKGVIGNLIVLSETATGTAVSSVTGGKLDGGIDGTVGLINEICADATYLYQCLAVNSIADANWVRRTVGVTF